MRHKNYKYLILLIGLLLLISWCGATVINSLDGFSHIFVKEGDVHSDPKGDAIEATINGHVLCVVFTENLGQVAIELSSVVEGDVDYAILNTPNGVNFIITNTGSYIVTFTLENGDMYYGEFEVTD